MKQTPARFILLFLVMTALALMARTSTTTQASPEWAAKVDASLMAATHDGDEAEFLIVLDAQADLSHAGRLGDKTERGRYVYETLTRLAARTQAPLRAMLDARRVTYRPYWVSNMIWARGDRAVLQAVATRRDVAHVYANKAIQADLPQPGSAASRQAGPVWNILLVRAPDVWAMGYTGQGAVVGGQDTGYEWQHPALINQYRGWDGTTADHDYNWHDAIHTDLSGDGSNPCGIDSAEPCDDLGHGTHTMGTMVGREPGHEVGMAPGAKWIGCRNMDSNYGTPQTYAECFEWFIAPYPIGGDSFTDGDPTKAPDVINNSWSCPPSEGCFEPEALRPVVEAVRAAGILTVQSAGNSGYAGCGTVSTPAAIYEASFTVGATDSADQRADFSSLGPVTIDGSYRMKPDAVAPGFNIYSSDKDNGYSLKNGTSMAAPHVAGMVALLISANPNLAGQVDALEAIITQTTRQLPPNSSPLCGTDSGLSIPNNHYGWGRIDALAAVNSFMNSLSVKLYLPALAR